MQKYHLYVALLVILVPPDNSQVDAKLIFDCTDVINDLLQNPDGSMESTTILEKALNVTTTIYYSSDEPMTSIFPDKFLTIVKLLDGLGWKIGTMRDGITLAILMKFDGTNMLDSENRNIKRHELTALFGVAYKKLMSELTITSFPVNLVLSFVSQTTCKIPHVAWQILSSINYWMRQNRGFNVAVEHNHDQIKCVFAGDPWKDFGIRVIPVGFIAGFRFPESYQLFEEYINDYRKLVDTSLKPFGLAYWNKAIFRMTMQASSNTTDVHNHLKIIQGQYSILLSRFAYKWSTESGGNVIIKLTQETLSNYVRPVEEMIRAINHVFPHLGPLPACPTHDIMHAVAKGQFQTLYFHTNTPNELSQCLSNLTTSAISNNNSFPKSFIVNLLLDEYSDTRALIYDLKQANITLTTPIWPVVSSQDLNPKNINLTISEKAQLVHGLEKLSKEIGCLIYLGLFNADPLAAERTRFKRNASAIADLIVNECQLVHFPQFRLIILEVLDLLRFDFKSFTFGTEDTYYMSYVQPLLHEIYLAREILKERYPHTKLILKLPLRTNLLYLSTISGQLYCDDDAKKENLYLEAFVVWSYIHNISIVAKGVFSEGPLEPGWFYELRGSQNKRYDSVYMLRNYPNTMGYLAKHPCVLHPTRPVNSRIQMNTKGMGCRVSLRVTDEDRLLTNREFQTQLQFVFTKFSKVELTGADIEEIIHKLEQLPSIVPNQTQIFVDYPLEKFVLDSAAAHIQKISNLRNKLSGEGINADFSIQISEWEERHENVNLLKDLQKLVNFADTNNVSLGIVFKNCSKARWYEQDILNSKVLSLSISHLTCDEPWETTFAKQRSYLVPQLARYKDELYATKLILENKFPRRKVYFRLEIPPSDRINYMRTVRDLNQHAELYNMTYFGIKAFEIEEPRLEDNRTEWDNGWWRVLRDRDLSNVFSYTELESDYFNQPTRRPEPIPEEQAREGSWWQITVPLAIFLVILLSILLASWKMSKTRFLTKEEEKEFLHGTSHDSGSYNYLNMKYNPNLEIPKTNTNSETCTIIGAGNFGTVYKALLKGRWVALKVPKEGCSKELFKTTLQEIKILCYIGGTHENVLAFVGAYIKEIRRGVVQIATELCKNGTLLEHLRNLSRSVAGTKRPCLYELVEPFDLERFCFEIASGMDYVTAKQIIHGDLATRNVLLDEHFTCKIGDFGLSRKLYEYEKYVKKSQEPLPWRWVAPEGLRKMEFSSKSDVWSYGVTLWEIYSLGDVPYPGLNWNVNFVGDLENGLRLQKPTYSPQSTYEKLLECWNIEAESRPTFSELAQFFQGLREKLYATFHDG